MKQWRTRKQNRKPVVPESMIVNSCIRLLYANNIFCYRQNTGAYKPDNSSRYIRYGYPGSADIVAIIFGRYIAIECKTEIGKQSDKQKAFQERVEQAGGVYLLVHSVEELSDALKPLLVPF